MPSRKSPVTIPATLIVNPVSGKGDPDERRKSLKSLAKENHWNGKYIETTKDITAGQIAKEEVEKGVKHLIICGGDGSIMEVLEAVVNKKVVLGIVPLGTGNLLARNLGIPLDTKEAMKVAFFGNELPIDVGRANGKYFSIIAGIGLDAEIMHGARRELKDKWGILAYVGSTLKNIRNRSGVYQITLDKKKPFVVRAKTIMTSNMGRLMGGVEVVPSTNPQNGSLQLGIIKSDSLKSWGNLLFHGLFGRIDNSPHYTIYNAEHIEIQSLRGKRYYQCDGDNFPPTDHLSIDIYPKAVLVHVASDVLDDPAKKKKQVLVFDFDGTLANSMELFIKVFNALAKKYNYPVLTPELQEEYRNLSAKELLTKLAIPKFRLPFLIAEGRKEFLKEFSTIEPIPGIAQEIALLSRKYTLGIVTSNDAAHVKQFLMNQKMDYFDFVYSEKSLFGKGKVINHLFKKYHFSRDNVIYVGDEVRDIDAARDAGINVISVTWGLNSKKKLLQHQPDFLVEKPSELSKLTPFNQ